MNGFFASGGQSIGASASASVLPMNIQGYSPLGWTGWISLLSKGLSRGFSSTTIRSHFLMGLDYRELWNSSSFYWKFVGAGHRGLSVTLLSWLPRAQVEFFLPGQWEVRQAANGRMDSTVVLPLLKPVAASLRPGIRCLAPDRREQRQPLGLSSVAPAPQSHSEAGGPRTRRPGPCLPFDNSGFDSRQRVWTTW